MQSTLFEPQSLPELPPQSMVDQWVFGSPLPLALACFAIGIIIFGALRHRKNARSIGLPALILSFVVGAALFIAANLITTDREHLKARSRELVAAASTGDRTALSNLLADQVRIQTIFVSKTGKDNIIALATTRAAPIISSASVKEVRVGLFGQQVAKTQIKVKVKADLVPPTSWWSIEWTRPTPESNQWVATHIEPIWIQGITNPSGSN